MEIIHKTIGQIIDEITRLHAAEDCVIHTETGVRYSYGLLLEEVRKITKGLIHEGIQRGDKVALWAPNVPEWIISMLALTKIGAITVPIDPGADRKVLSYILEQSGCRGIILAEGLGDMSYVDVLQGTWADLPELKKAFVIGSDSYQGMTSWSELESMGQGTDPRELQKIEEKVSPEDPVAIMYTSGTTGSPKGVVLDHLGLINKSMHSTARQGIHHADKLCLFFPLFHMFGNTCITLAGLLRGAALVIPSKVFDPSRILHAIKAEQCTALYASPSMVIALLDHPDFRQEDWRSVRKGIIGGAPCPMELMKRLVEDIGVSQVTVGYGITETCSWITMTHPKDPIELRVSTIGAPLACNEVKIVDPATGEDLPPNTQGEICTRGFLMKEYYKMPGATAAAIDREGWFHSGDLGEMDDKGYARITGRLKDMIQRNAIDIHPVDLEEIIYRLPGVTEVQVFGFPHPEKGQEVAAWIKLKEGAQLSVREVSAHVQENVDSSLAPRHYKFVSEFPMTRSGKVQKFKLAEMAQNEYEALPGFY
ncbi:MAG: AMP-binding protein [Desulfatiglandaceae bacterium]|jgi:fatty-acyl-CoA synthase